MSEIKNLICMSVALCLTVGFATYISGDTKNSSSGSALTVITEKTESVSTVSSTAPIDTIVSSAALSQGIPELTCPKVEFDDGSILFANADSSYTLINSSHERIYTITVEDDNGDSIMMVCSGGMLVMQKNGQNIDEFIYNGHSIGLSEGKLLYDKSPVEYNDTAFSSYKLSDEFTLECTAASKFTLKKPSGTTANMGKITDDNGNELEIVASRTGFEATNSEGLIEPTFKVNGDLIVVSNGNVYINGQQLVPPGFNDISVVEKKTETTTTKKKTKKTTTTTTTKKTETTAQTESQTEPETTTTVIATTTTTQAPTTTTTTTQKTTTTTTVTTTAKPKPTNSDVSDLTREMLGYVNEARKQYGLEPVYGLKSLDGVASVRAKELVSSYSHTRPNGKTYDTAIDEAGLEWWHCAENIANGIPGMTTAKEAFDAWMSSEGHRKNILNPKMKYMAVAKTSIDVDGMTKTFWDQIFFNDEYVP